MKKIFLIIILILSFIFLTGCQNNISKNEITYNNERINTSTIPEDNNIFNITSSDNTNNTKSEPKVISNFSTKIYDKSKGRMNNLNVAAKKLSNITINSNEVFSFNDEMGPSNKENGYEKAKIFDAHGNVLNGYGGGICQISTTLYNAALNLNLEILERHDHSNKVQYIETGKDAAISYDHLDLKFKNIFEYPISIQCRIENNSVIVDITK